MILDAREKFEEARKSPKEKKPRMAVDETFPQGRVGMNRARKAVAGEEQRAKEEARTAEKSGPARNHGKDEERNKEGDGERASRKVRRRDSISHCKVFRATAGKGEDGRKDDADARRKTKGAREENGLG